MSEYINLVAPLPCCTLVAIQHRCNAPTTVAHALRLGDGSWRIEPICMACAATMAKIYGRVVAEIGHEEHADG